MSSLGNKLIMSNNIRYYMKTLGKSRTEICEAIGVKYTTFTDWVNGKTYPRIDKIELMANYFGVTKADLVEKHHPDDRINVDFQMNYGSQLETFPKGFPTTSKVALSMYAKRMSEILSRNSIQDLLEAADGCTDEQIQVAINVLKSYKPQQK